MDVDPAELAQVFAGLQVFVDPAVGGRYPETVRPLAAFPSLLAWAWGCGDRRVPRPATCDLRRGAGKRVDCPASPAFLLRMSCSS